MGQSYVKTASSSAHPLDRLAERLGSKMATVNALILERMASPVPLIGHLAGHIIAAGGKRIRPLLTLASAQLCGYDGHRDTDLAACVEFLHTATLLHDDVVDESNLRRGRPSANALWGNQASVLVGDFLFTRAFELMVKDGDLNVLSTISHAATTITEGEIMQLSHAGDLSMTQDLCIQIIAAKTAALFQAACVLGALVAKTSSDLKDALYMYGMNLGIAFQIVDDVLDYSAHEKTLGKRVGDDFRENKVTLPVMFAYAAGTAVEKDFWHRTLRDNDMTDGDFETAMDIITSHGALAKTMDLARHYAAQARDAMDIFPDTPLRRDLQDLTAFCVNRDY